MAGGVVILMLEDVDLRSGKPAAAVDDGRVVQLVGDDVILGLSTPATVLPALAAKPDWNDARLRVLELSRSRCSIPYGDPWFGYGSHCPGPGAVFASGLDGSFDELGMSGQAEIIIGREIDDGLCR